MPLKTRYHAADKEDGYLEIGIDEAGRGSFWGPITAGAACLRTEESAWTDEQRALMEQLRDSKKISPKKRERLYDQLIACEAIHVGTGMVHSDEINEHGIQWANREAFRRAAQAILTTMEIDPLSVITGTATIRLIIDGVLSIDNWKCEQHMVVEGDNTYLVIAAASIMAKVAHDRWIQQYVEEHPDCEERYHLRSSKGYGTAAHREAIRVYGAHALHREVYIQHWLPGAEPRPVKKITKETGCLIRLKPDHSHGASAI